MPRRHHKATNVCAFNVDDRCLFCARGSDNDNLAVGPLYSKDNIRAHKNCLYFGATLVQANDAIDSDSEGADQLFFFTIDSIKKEAKRSAKLKCSFCKVPNASAGCNNRKCKKKFHFPCGLENQVMFNFREFASLCTDHQPRQDPNDAAVDLLCHICQDEVDASPSFDQIYCPVCKRWLHRNCVQIWAYKAGVHHLRCPMCNNADEFKEELYRLGFELPDRDAEWEREGQFREQENGVILKCCAEKCCCGRGREYSAKKGSLEIVACIVCGEAGIHRCCIDTSNAPDPWECEICERVSLKLEAQRIVETMYLDRVRSRQLGLGLVSQVESRLLTAKQSSADHISISDSDLSDRNSDYRCQETILAAAGMIQHDDAPAVKRTRKDTPKSAIGNSSSEDLVVASTNSCSSNSNHAPSAGHLVDDNQNLLSLQLHSCQSSAPVTACIDHDNTSMSSSSLAVVKMKCHDNSKEYVGSGFTPTPNDDRVWKALAVECPLKYPVTSSSRPAVDCNQQQLTATFGASARTIPSSVNSNSVAMYPLFRKRTLPSDENPQSKPSLHLARAPGDSSNRLSPLLSPVVVDTILID